VPCGKRRRAATHLSLWLTASLLVGTSCASLAATEDGQMGDGTWSQTGPGAMSAVASEFGHLGS
jgi:hypothetical protein